jgi:hypothetical protein
MSDLIPINTRVRVKANAKTAAAVFSGQSGTVIRHLEDPVRYRVQVDEYSYMWGDKANYFAYELEVLDA